MVGSDDVRIAGAPTDDEVAAVLAALQVAWPTTAGGAAEVDGSRWRWAGRWWSKPVPQRRVRPW